mmetsp:Transcript_51863/g.135321  ORF Transcript_51863/g.135321 Transcript_51863/m.135321 type:complete len:118 (-) Transcript_51863:103-456(-)
MDGWMDGWDGWMDGWMGWMDGWMDADADEGRAEGGGYSKGVRRGAPPAEANQGLASPLFIIKCGSLIARAHTHTSSFNRQEQRQNWLALRILRERYAPLQQGGGGGGGGVCVCGGVD